MNLKSMGLVKRLMCWVWFLFCVKISTTDVKKKPLIFIKLQIEKLLPLLIAGHTQLSAHQWHVYVGNFVGAFGNTVL